MSDGALLALTGSNLTGDAPYSVALAVADRVHALASPAGGRGDLAGLVSAACAAAGLAAADVRRVRVDVGPGSYTGLRVALTFVRCLQRFGGVAVEAVDSLALLAARAAAPAAAPRRVHAVLDARRERVHAQAFEVGPASVRALAPAAAVSVAVAAAAVGAGDLVVVPAALPAALRAAFADRSAEVRDVAGLVASELLAPGLPFAPAGFADLEPRYLMGSYAED
ncbi:MAG: tRNA (adenosine(37)-N6)-threonylcarbamoyltransferase complex dimerization subunit type 1 TsaB [Planctomycetes bacterium]|nr:tRNA (adenosine(37)-N6)-threonylcarbamoyltransferase complex dimerization subunit type 1 TsaB [Planctomycetota bacterium]